MSRRIRTTEPTAPRIRTSEPTMQHVDPRAVGKALGGEPCSERLEGSPGPITLYALRQELLGRRQSSGGRPGIEGTSFRAKIPLGEHDWQRLETLAATLSAEGFSPSAGQVGSVLLSLALRSLTKDFPSSESEQAGCTAALAKELAARLAAEKSR
jgi:hypothetical protein